MKQRVTFGRLASVAAGLLVAASTVSLSAGQDAGKTTNQAVYTAAQADRGKKAFAGNCTTCHDTARFTGDEFIKHWSGQPLHAIFDLMRTTMPEDNPGGLQPQQYADILSYFLQLNGFPAGADELKGTDDAMRAVKMEAPKKASGGRSVR